MQHPSDVTQYLPSHIDGYLSVEAGEILPSHTEAARPGDDIDI